MCVLRWKDLGEKGKARELVMTAEFRSFVRPTWRPQLSDFCQALTGITQVSLAHLRGPVFFARLATLWLPVPRLIGN